MLNALDLARLIKAALDDHTPPLSHAGLATECGVTPQAVNGWITNGRVAKKHLPKIAGYTGKPLGYFLGVITEPQKIEQPLPPVSLPIAPKFGKLAPEEMTIIESYRNCTKKGKEFILSSAQAARTAYAKRNHGS